MPSEAALVQAGLGARVRKEEALLYQLDQHSRGLVPGNTAHKPQHKPAVSLEAPPPTSATTQVWLGRCGFSWQLLGWLLGQQLFGPCSLHLPCLLRRVLRVQARRCW